MINLKQFKGFAALIEDDSSEVKNLHIYCLMNNVKLVYSTSCPKDFIPVGSVEWCLKALGRNIKPDNYPEWLSDKLYRGIVVNSNYWPVGDKKFIKPYDKYKRFTGFITKGDNSDRQEPPFYISKIVNFVDEWRYYVTNGEIKYSSWYQGENELIDAPKLDINIPEDYCGTLDFGKLDTGELALVEAHHPFACGWYGDKRDFEIFIQWLIDGWEYMLR